jgi:hypothetical protein
MDATLAMSRLPDGTLSASQSLRLFQFVAPLSGGLHRLTPEQRTKPNF